MGKPRMTELEMADLEAAGWRHQYEQQKARAEVAEAEAYGHKQARAELNERCTQYRERAEAAEAELAELQDAYIDRLVVSDMYRYRLERAVDRINAALDECDDETANDELDQYAAGRAAAYRGVRRMLTGGVNG